MKKNLFTVILMGILAFFSVFIFYQIQEKDIVLKLNNHNLSHSSYQIQLKDRQAKMATLTKALEGAKKIDDVQIHFQSLRDPKYTYFYGKGDFATPPMLMGSFFSEASFDSEVPTAVVGKDWEKKLYKPQSQAYLKLKGQYVPVIGVMGSKYKSDLDRQIFIALPKETLAKNPLKNYHVIVDGGKDLSKKALTKTVALKTIAPAVSDTFIISQGAWVKDHLLQFITLACLVLLAFLTVLVWTLSAKGLYRQVKLSSLPKEGFVFQEWGFYSFFVGLGNLLGLVLGMFSYSLTSYTWLLVYNIASFIGLSLVFRTVLINKIKKW